MVKGSNASNPIKKIADAAIQSKPFSDALGPLPRFLRLSLRLGDPLQLAHDVVRVLPPFFRIFGQAGLHHSLQRRAAPTAAATVLVSGSAARMAATMLAWLLPSNAFLPVAISYTTAPKAKMSVRASASLPSSCSGAMYCNVPAIVPSAVTGCIVAVAAISLTIPAPDIFPPAMIFANPKSSSFTPVRVSMMLPGFRSR